MLICGICIHHSTQCSLRLVACFVFYHYLSYCIEHLLLIIIQQHYSDHNQLNLLEYAWLHIVLNTGAVPECVII